MSYDDAPGAIEWLTNAFGFTRHLVVPGENGTIAHAQLSLGNGMIMLGSSSNREGGHPVKTPSHAEGNTRSVYIVVDKIDAHYEHAKASGAEICYEIEDQDYSGRMYGAFDPEGHLWYFGSYNPWQEESANG
jgi:uncharacterized glyoxalase superfamily protein PhnB